MDSHERSSSLDSYGIELSYGKTACSTPVMVVARDGSDAKMAWDMDIAGLGDEHFHLLLNRHDLSITTKDESFQNRRFIDNFHRPGPIIPKLFPFLIPLGANPSIQQSQLSTSLDRIMATNAVSRILAANLVFRLSSSFLCGSISTNHSFIRSIPISICPVRLVADIYSALGSY